MENLVEKLLFTNNFHPHLNNTELARFQDWYSFKFVERHKILNKLRNKCDSQGNSNNQMVLYHFLFLSSKEERLPCISSRGWGIHLKLRLNAQNSHLTSYAYNLFLFDFRYHLGSIAPVVGLKYFTSLTFQISVKLFSVFLYVDSLYPQGFQGHPCHDPCCLPNVPVWLQTPKHPFSKGHFAPMTPHQAFLLLHPPCLLLSSFLSNIHL